MAGLLRVRFIAATIWLLAALSLAGCASQLRAPTAPLTIEIQSVDFVTGSSAQIRFDVKGTVLNPNDLVIKVLGFTYQTFIEGDLVGSGDVETLSFFPFKSRTSFVVPLRIPTNRIGGYVNAVDRSSVAYKVNLQLTDERLKRTSLIQQGNVNLVPLLRLPETEAKLTNYNAQLVADTSVFNPNDFILLIDKCSLDFPAYQSVNELFATGAVAPSDDKTFRVALPFTASVGDQVAAISTCIVDGTPIEKEVLLKVH